MTYQNLATVYDYFMEGAPYDDWVHFAKKAFKTYGKNIHSVVDLGCGTGEISIRLRKNGFDMTGIDLSADMLAIAEEKARSQNISIQWMKQDIVSLQGLTG